MNQVEIFNIYVEKLSNSVSELTKTNILQSAQIAYYEKLNSSLNSRIEELEKNLDKALNKVDSKSKKSDNEF
jgi:chaperonin cofactor prefoldin